MNGLDWTALLKAGVQQAGLSPAQVWALTPYELGLVLRVEELLPPLTRARLEELDAQYGGGPRDA